MWWSLFGTSWQCWGGFVGAWETIALSLMLDRLGFSCRNTMVLMGVVIEVATELPSSVAED